ncbi:hypothetical protein AMECASPLE_033817 [Ameca splendens]|uniref:Uncharacterized protein n=1 Tax=Ameca splendens TaxID=208324 RepID=A0ABV0YTX8_9TELE
MIDDRMTLSDPVEELCLFACKETLAHCASPVPVPQRSSGRERFLGKGVLLYSQWCHGKSTATVCLAVPEFLLPPGLRRPVLRKMQPLKLDT